MSGEAATLLTDFDVRRAGTGQDRVRRISSADGGLVHYSVRDGSIVWLASPSLPTWVPAIVDDLVRLALLGDNWDSYGARPIRSENITTAFEALLTLVRPTTPRPYVVPTVSGGVQFEWHTEGADLEIEIAAPLRLEVFWEPAAGPAVELEIISDFQRLRDWIAQIS